MDGTTSTARLGGAWRFLTPGRLLFAAVGWLTLEHFALGKYSFLSAGDNGEFMISGLLAGKLWQGDAPLWHVYSTAGIDRLSLGYFSWLNQSAFAFLPGWLASQILTVSQIVAATLGTYGLCRRSLGLGRLASGVSGFLYGYSVSAGQLILSVIAYLPLSILVLTRVLDNRTDAKRWIALVAMGFVLSQTAYLSRLMPFVPIMYLLWFLTVDRRRSAADWLIIGVFAALMAMPRLQEYAAVATYAVLSHRQEWWTDSDFSAGFFLTRAQEFFLGTWPRVFATGMIVLGLARSQWRQGLGGFVLALLAGFALVAAVPLVKPLLDELLPFTRGFDLHRLAEYLWLFLALGSAYGISAIQSLAARADAGTGHVAMGRVAAVASVVVLALLLVLSLQQKYRNLKEWVSQGSYVLNFESPVLRDLAGEIALQTEPTRATSFQMYPAYLNAYGIETAGGYQALQLKRYHEFWSRLTAPGMKTYPQYPYINQDRLMASPAEHRPEWRLESLYDPELLSLANVKYVVSRDRLVGARLVARHQPAAPWSGQSTRQKIMSNVRGNFSGRTHLYVFENIDVLPRFLLVDRLRAMATGAQVLDALAEASLEELRTTAFAEAPLLPPGLRGDPRLNSGIIRVTRYDGDDIWLAAELEGESVLVVTNPFSPYWKCTVDGIGTPIFPADHAFWGVHLPKSARQIRFRYDPPFRIL